jgi:hypothetical protein
VWVVGAHLHPPRRSTVSRARLTPDANLSRPPCWALDPIALWRCGRSPPLSSTVPGEGIGELTAGGNTKKAPLEGAQSKRQTGGRCRCSWLASSQSISVILRCYGTEMIALTSTMLTPRLCKIAHHGRAISTVPNFSPKLHLKVPKSQCTAFSPFLFRGRVVSKHPRLCRHASPREASRELLRNFRSMRGRTSCCWPTSHI